jgi:putative ABC transport system permease protein
MLVAAIKTLGLVAGVAALIALVVVVLVLAVAFVRMLAVSVVQWRDLFSFDRWTEVLLTIGRNKLRTALTMISVAWGIFVLVALLGAGRGLDAGMRKKFAKNATNGVWINANKTSVAYGGYDVGRLIQFENADYLRTRNIEGVEHMSARHFLGGNRWGSQYTRRGGKANTFGINAVYPETFHLEQHTMLLGRFLNEADIAQRRKSAVIGKVVADYLFEGDPPIGDYIVVGSVPFQVVGVFTDPAGADEERAIYVPATTAQLAFNGGEKLGQLQLTVGNADAAGTQAVIDRIVGKLAETHNFSRADRQAVRVHNNIEQFGRFRKMFWMISAFIVVIGLGTLAAGVVGVSNIMMIAVKERTKEIGVRKALGATPSSIVFMVLQEAVFLTAIAGLLGLTGGVVVLDLLGRMKNDFLLNPHIDLSTGLVAAGFLVLAGAFAGYFPARAAAKVNPIHALRDT